MYKSTILSMLLIMALSSASQARQCTDLLIGKNIWNMNPVGLKKKIPLPTSYKDLVSVHDRSLLRQGDLVRVKVKNPDLTSRATTMTYEGAFIGLSGSEKSIVISGGEQLQNYTSTIRTRDITNIEIIAISTPIRMDQLKEGSTIAYSDSQLTTLADFRPSIFTGAMTVGRVARNNSEYFQLEVKQTKFKNESEMNDDISFAHVKKDSVSWVKQYSNILDIPMSDMKPQMTGRLTRKIRNRTQVIDIVITKVDNKSISYQENISDMPASHGKVYTMEAADFVGFYLLRDI